MSWKVTLFFVFLFLTTACGEIFAKTEQWGFLPNWRLADNPRVDLVDKLFFFSVPVKGDGNLQWDFASRRIFSESFKKQSEIVRNKGGKVGVVFSMLKDKDLDKFLTNKDYWEVFFRQASELEKKIGADMFNIDFEYQNEPHSHTR
jgi:hypothetical protein